MATRAGLGIIEITKDGRRWKLDPRQLTGADDLAIYKACGFTIADVYGGGLVTLMTVAAVWWRFRVAEGEQLTYEQAAAELTFDDLIDEDKLLGDPAEEDAGAPPASAGS